MIIRKSFFDFDAEEKWLNEMASKGFNLIKYTFWKCEFEETEPNKYIYRIQLLDDNIKSEKGREYIDFMKETGAEYIGNHFYWVYFRKEFSEDGFELYSDNKSKLEHYNRIFSLLLLALSLNFLAWISNLFSGIATQLYFQSIISFISLILTIIIAPITISLYKKIKLLKEEMNLFQ